MFRTAENSYKIINLAVQYHNRMNFGAENEGLADVIKRF